jgi:hypothetical protein
VPCVRAVRARRACRAVRAVPCVRAVRACRACVPCLHGCLPGCVLACLPGCVLACLPGCVLACLPGCMQACMHSHACMYACMYGWVDVDHSLTEEHVSLRVGSPVSVEACPPELTPHLRAAQGEVKAVGGSAKKGKAKAS